MRKVTITLSEDTIASIDEALTEELTRRDEELRMIGNLLDSTNDLEEAKEQVRKAHEEFTTQIR